MVLCVFHIEVIVWSCQSQEDGFKLKCSSTTLHFIFLLQTDFTVGEDDAVWNFEYWWQPPACIFFQSAYFVWMMRHIVGRVFSSSQRHCLKGMVSDFQWKAIFTGQGCEGWSLKVWSIRANQRRSNTQIKLSDKDGWHPPHKRASWEASPVLQLPQHNSLPIYNEGRRLHPAELESCLV